MRRPSAQRQGNARSLSLPAATKGWVTIKNLGQMGADEAITLDNFFPLETSIQIRRGSAIHNTGVGASAVETIFGYHGVSTNKLLAASSSKFYDCTTSGVSTEIATGFTSGRWQGVQAGTEGGTFGLFVNGADGPQIFDGTTMSTNALTGDGLDKTKLIQVTIFKERPFYVEKDSLNVWYAESVRNVSGNLLKLPLASFCRLGGYIVAAATWTRDGGSGINDLIAFITSMGEILIYQGTNPSDSSAWGLVGVYRVGAPLGRRPFFKFANDIAVLTQDGFLPLGSVLSRDRTGLSSTAISKNIAPTVTQVAELYKSTFGWEGLLYPQGRMAIVNVPVGATKYQYVLNTNTQAWCRFTGLDAAAWTIFQDQAYFGDSAGRVWMFDTGTADNTTAITGQFKQSFQYFGNRNSTKHFNLVRPIFQSDGELTYKYTIDTDFNDTLPEGTLSSQSSGTEWDVGAWDTSDWADSVTTIQDWESANEIGRCASLKFQVATDAISVSHLGTDWAWTEGGIL